MDKEQSQQQPFNQDPLGVASQLPKTPTTPPPPLFIGLRNNSKPNAAIDLDPENIAREILYEAKQQVRLSKECEESCLELASSVLTTATGLNEMHFLETCSKSKNFKEIFVGFAVEKLVNKIKTDENFLPTQESMEALIKDIDAELMDEGEFVWNHHQLSSHKQNQQSFSWNEQSATGSSRTLLLGEESGSSLLDGSEAGLHLIPEGAH